MNLGFKNKWKQVSKEICFFLVKIKYERIVKYIENDQ